MCYPVQAGPRASELEDAFNKELCPGGQAGMSFARCSLGPNKCFILIRVLSVLCEGVVCCEDFTDQHALGAQCSNRMFPRGLRSLPDFEQAGTVVDDHTFADSSFDQLSRSRTLATVTDDPLSKKVEMTNWEQVCYQISRLLFRNCVVTVGRLIRLP